MALSFGSTVFQRNTLYDGGNVNAALRSSFLQSGILTVTAAGSTTGNLIGIYSYDPTNSFGMSNCASGTNKLVWDMEEKIHFKNIYATYQAAKSDCAGGSMTITIDGSNDNSAWTTLATHTYSGANATFSLLATDVTYRYIRLQATSGSAYSFAVINVLGVI